MFNLLTHNAVVNTEIFFMDIVFIPKKFTVRSHILGLGSWSINGGREVCLGSGVISLTLFTKRFLLSRLSRTTGMVKLIHNGKITFLCLLFQYVLCFLCLRFYMLAYMMLCMASGGYHKYRQD